MAGIDPRDGDVTVQDRMLTVRATRHEPDTEKTNSEFRCGTVIPPVGADGHSIVATYANGILTVRVDVAATGKSARRIPIGQVDR